MRSSTLSQWLDGLRARATPKNRRTVLGVNPLEARTVPAALAGSVFIDANDNGVRDCGEAGIPGVKVQLAGKTDCGVIVCKETVTDCQGNYKFEGMAAGWYAVTEWQPAKYRDGKDSAGSAGGRAILPDTIACVRLENCTSATGYVFGERPGCSNGSSGKGSHGKGSSGKGSHGKGSSGKGSHGKGSSGKGSHGKGSSGKGSHGKGSSGKGSHGRCDMPRTKGNNGVGNGIDAQPPGNPRVNDGPGTSPGNPGNKR